MTGVPDPQPKPKPPEASADTCTDAACNPDSPGHYRSSGPGCSHRYSWCHIYTVSSFNSATGSFAVQYRLFQ